MQLTEVEDIQTVDPYIQRFRDAMTRSRDSSIIELNQQRENDFANIMAQANKAGMLYSNFPARTKTQYNVSTYNPNLIKIQSAYTTGLNDLRNKGVELANYLRGAQESIDDYAYYSSLLKS